MSDNREVLARLDRIADLLQQVLVARQPDARRTAVCAVDAEVLQVLRELFCAPPWKRDRLFTAAEAVSVAKDHADLHARLTAALGTNTARALGKLLSRVAGRPVDGAVVTRQSIAHGTTIWGLSRVSGGFETRESRPPPAPRD